MILNDFIIFIEFAFNKLVYDFHIFKILKLLINYLRKS